MPTLELGTDASWRSALVSVYIDTKHCGLEQCNSSLALDTKSCKDSRCGMRLSSRWGAFGIEGMIEEKMVSTSWVWTCPRPYSSGSCTRPSQPQVGLDACSPTPELGMEASTPNPKVGKETSASSPKLGPVASALTHMC
jgi:hypothetical protein